MKISPISLHVNKVEKKLYPQAPRATSPVETGVNNSVAYPKDYYTSKIAFTSSPQKKMSDEELFNMLANEKVIFEGESRHSYGSDEIREIIELSHKNYEKTMELVKSKMHYGDNIIPRYSAEEMGYIFEAYDMNPELSDKLQNWKMSTREGDSNYRFDGEETLLLVEQAEDDPDFMNSLLELSEEEFPYTYALSRYEISNLMRLGAEHKDAIKSTLKSNFATILLPMLDNENIVALTNKKNYDDFFVKGADDYSIEQFSDTNIFRFTSYGEKENIIKEYNLSDSKIELLSTERVKEKEDKISSIRTFADGSKIINYQTKKPNGDYFDSYSNAKTFIDPNGDSIKSEYIHPLEDGSGEYRIYFIDKSKEKAKKVTLGGIQYRENEIHTKDSFRVLYSHDGTKTTHTRTSNDNGDIIKYKVTDKNNELLYSQTRTTKKIDETTKITTLNDKSFGAAIDNRGIAIMQLDEKMTPVKTLKKSYRTYDKHFIEAYKQMPADMFILLDKLKTKIRLDDMPEEMGAEYDSITQSINVSKNFSDDAFTLAHETGHGFDLDLIDKLHNDKEFKEIFKEELMKYNKNCTISESTAINYFIKKGGLGEVIAESYAILSGCQNYNHDDIKLRTILLEKNFPKTIAYIGNAYNNCGLF